MRTIEPIFDSFLHTKEETANFTVYEMKDLLKMLIAIAIMYAVVLYGIYINFGVEKWTTKNIW